MSDTIVADKMLADRIVPHADDPDGEVTITEAFIADNGTVMSVKDVSNAIIRGSMRCFDSTQIHHEIDNDPRFDMLKSVAGTTQSDSEIGRTELGLNSKVVEPPYPPEVLSKFLEVDETHFRCVKTKVSDSVGRHWEVSPLTKESGDVFDPSTLSEAEKSAINAEITEVRQFIENCNDVIEFEGVLDRACMDFETIGWGAFEVIRSRDMKIAKIAHIPSSRLRVLRGWKGFVEVIGPDQFVYYQMFGRKVVSGRTDLVSGEPESYNPREDGELNPANQNWNLIDRDTGKSTRLLARAANEIVWVPKHHSNTIYYGLPDIVPALGDVLGNIHIRDYMLQYFDHNTVPQYAIIVEGAKMSPQVMETIQTYFSQEVKGQAHKTLIIPVPASGREVKIRFEKLAENTSRESGFQETRKQNQQGILTAHGVSPAIIGIADNANLGSGKGLSQAEIYKEDRIVTPSQSRWERLLNKLFRLGLGVTRVGIEFERLDIRDLELEMRVETGYFDRGLKAVNEVRKSSRLGDPTKGGDRPFFKANSPVMFLDTLDEDVQRMQETEQQMAELSAAKVQFDMDDSDETLEETD